MKNNSGLKSRYHGGAWKWSIGGGKLGWLVCLNLVHPLKGSG